MDEIEAPDTVEQGRSAPIDVRCPGRTQSVLVVDSSTGESTRVTVGSDRRARFELFSGSRSGSTLLIVDEDDPTKSAVIVIVDASSL